MQVIVVFFFRFASIQDQGDLARQCEYIVCGFCEGRGRKDGREGVLVLKALAKGFFILLFFKINIVPSVVCCPLPSGRWECG